MGIPTWTPGEVLAAADVNAWFVPLAAYFTAGTQTVNSGTFANVTGVSIATVGTGTYRMECRMYWTPNQSAGSAKFQLTTGGMTTTAFQGAWFEYVAAAAPGAGTAFGGNAGTLTGLNVTMQSSTMGSADRAFHAWAVITVSVAGALTLQASCSTGADTWVIESGYLELQRLN
jgi:hypothetical protein